MKKQLLFLSLLLLTAYTPYAASSAYEQSSIGTYYPQDDEDDEWTTLDVNVQTTIPESTKGGTTFNNNFMQSSIGGYDPQDDENDYEIINSERTDNFFDAANITTIPLVLSSSAEKEAYKDNTETPTTSKESQKKKKVSFAPADQLRQIKFFEIIKEDGNLKDNENFDAIKARAERINEDNKKILEQKIPAILSLSSLTEPSTDLTEIRDHLSETEFNAVRSVIAEDATKDFSLIYLRNILKSGLVPGEYETNFAQKIQKKAREVINAALLTPDITIFKTVLLQLNENDLEKLETELNNTKRSALPKVNAQDKITALVSFKAQ